MHTEALTCVEIIVGSALLVLHLLELRSKHPSDRRHALAYQPTRLTIVLMLAVVGGILFFVLETAKPGVFHLVTENWDIIWKGLWITISVSALSILCGSFLGLLAALVLSIPKPNIWLSLIDSFIWALIYILLGIPALVLLFLCRYALPISVYWASALALGLNLSPFVAKIVTASIRNIPKEQIDSATSFGYNPMQVFWHFKFSFVLKNASQSLLVEYYTTIKLSSLAALISLPEFYHATQDITHGNSEPIGSYIIMATGYVLIVSWIAILADFVDHKWAPSTAK